MIRFVDTTLPPGPPLPSFIQGMLVFSKPGLFLGACRRRYGDAFTVRVGRMGTYVYICDPDDIRTVFRDHETFHAGEANAPFLAPVLGSTSVLVTDGPSHSRQRRLMMPAFHGNSVATLAAVMEEVARAEIERWPVGVTFEARPRMQVITLEVILRAVIGADDEARLQELREALPPLVELDMLALMQFAFPQLRDRWPWKRFRAVQERADAALYAEIENCRRDPHLEERHDVLAMLVRSRDEDGMAMTDQELRDQLVTLLLAGHETTATGLAWSLERLVRHPSILERARTAAQDDDAAYLNAVINETLRVRPVIADVTRRVTRPTTVAGHRLPTGVMVDPAILLVHRSPDNYDGPQRFDPGRFEGSSPDPSVWLSFGGGNRRCIGATFAATEMRIVLREILRRVELEPTDASDEPAKVRHVTLIPKRQARIRVARRLSPAAEGTAPSDEAVAASPR